VTDKFVEHGLYHFNNQSQPDINQESLEETYSSHKGGCLLLAYYDSEPVGCGAIKKISENSCEIKRVSV